MSNNKMLFVLDLDGTTLFDHTELHDNLFDTVKEVKKLGHEIVILTGRPLEGSIQFHKQLGLDGLIGTLNGNAIIDTKTGKQISGCKMDSKIFKTFVESRQFKKHIVDYAWEHNGIVYSSYNLTKWMDYWYHSRHWKEIDSIDVIQDEVGSGFIVINPDNCELLENFFSKHSEIIVYKWEKLYKGKNQVYELFNSDCTKGTATEFIANYYNIPPERTYVFGDGTNDIKMFELEGVNSWAVNNAHDELKKYAKNILELTNKEGAVGIKIKEIIKNGR